MKYTFKIFALLAIILSTSCSDIDYKHADKPDFLNCDVADSKLIKEAVYDFETYLIENYKYRDLSGLEIAYSNYWTTVASNYPIKTDNLSEHTKAILAKLSEDESLWSTRNGKIVLNQSHPVVACIADNMVNADLKTTFNALLQANSLRSELFIPAMRRDTHLIAQDKVLATYIALELFYARLMDMDLSISDKDRAIKLREQQRQNLNHDGHNHNGGNHEGHNHN